MSESVKNPDEQDLKNKINADTPEQKQDATPASSPDEKSKKESQESKNQLDPQPKNQTEDQKVNPKEQKENQDSKAENQSDESTEEKVEDDPANDKRLGLYVIQPYPDFYKGAVEKYRSEEEAENVRLIEVSDIRILAQELRARGSGVIIFSVKDRNSAAMLGNICRIFKEGLKAGLIRLFVTTTFKQPKVIRNFEKMGVSTIEMEPIADKAFQFKVKRQLQTLEGKIKAAERKAELEKKRLANGGGGAAGDQKSKNKVVMQPPLTLASDFFLMKGGGGKAFWGRWSIQLTGPSPRVGRWFEDEELSKDGEVVYRWDKQGDEKGKFLKDEGTWYCFGAKPEFRENLWNFSGRAPRLVFINNGKELAKRFWIDEKSKDLFITKDSEQGLAFIELILESIEAAVRFGIDGQNEGKELELSDEDKARLAKMKDKLLKNEKSESEWDTEENLKAKEKEKKGKESDSKFEKDEEKQAREMNDKIGEDEKKNPRDINDKIGEDEDKSRDINDKIGEDEDKSRDINDKIGEDEDKSRDINDKTGEDEDNTRDMNDKIGEDEDKSRDMNDKIGEDEDKSRDINDKTNGDDNKKPDINDKTEGEEEDKPPINDKVTKDDSKPGEINDKTTKDKDPTTYDHDDAADDQFADDEDKANKEGKKEDQSKDMKSRFRDDENEKEMSDKGSVEIDQEAKEQTKKEEKEEEPPSLADALDQSSQFEDGEDVEKQEEKKDSAFVDQAADSDASSQFDDEDAPPLENPVSDRFDDAAKDMPEETKEALGEAQKRAAQKRAFADEQQKEKLKEQEDDQPAIKPMDESGPSMSPIAIAFMTAELMIKPESDDPEIATKFCQYLAAAMNGMDIELWYIDQNKNPQFIGKNREDKDPELEEHVKAFLGDSEISGSQEPKSKRLENDILVSDIFSAEKRRIGVLVLKGDDALKVPEEYLQKVGAMIRGLLESLNQGLVKRNPKKEESEAA